MLLSNRRVRELLLVGETERTAVVWLFGFSLLSGIPQLVTMTAASALLVEQLPPEALPWLMLANGGGVSLLAGLMILFLRDRSAGARMSAICLFLVAGSLALSIASVVIGPAPATSVLFYFWSRVENVFLAVGFLIAANAQFSPRAGRRVLGFASTGQVMTLIVAGAAIPVALRFITPDRLIFVSLAAHVLLFVHTRRLPAEAAAVSVSTQTAVDQLPNGATIRDQRRLAWGVFVAIALMYVTYFLVDTAFLGGINTSLSGRSQGGDVNVGAFVARFWVGVGLVALATKLLFTGRFLHRFGIMGGMLSGPIVLTLLFAAALILESSGRDAGGLLSPLVVVVVLKGMERIIDGSLFLPGYYGMFQAFEPRAQARNQMLAESVIGQGVASLAGFVLVLTRLSESFSLATIYALGFAIAATWVVASTLGVAAYRGAMARFLSPPVRKSWPRGRPTPSRRLKTSRDSSAAGGTLTRGGGSGGPDGWTIPERLEFARTLLLRRPSGRDEWPPLAEAIENEWNRNLGIIAERIDAELGAHRLHDRLTRLQGMTGREFGLAVDGLTPLIPPVYREVLPALLERDEPFLLDRAFRGLPPPEHTSDAKCTSGAVDDLAPAGGWTKTVLALSREHDREDIWATRYADMLHLKRSDVFRLLPHELLYELSLGATRRRVPGGTRLVTDGDEGESMFVITSGSVAVIKGRRLLATLGAGSCVGELSAVLPERRSATVIACEPVEALVLDRAVLVSFLRREPLAVRTLQSILLDRIRTRLAPASQALQASVRLPYEDRTVEPSPEESFRLLDQHELLSDLRIEALLDLCVNVSYIELRADESVRLAPTPRSQLWVLVEGQAREIVSEIILAEHQPGAIVGAPGWLGFPAAEMRVEAAGSPKGAARFAVVEAAVYDALLSDSSTFQVGILNALVAISRSLARRVR